MAYDFFLSYRRADQAIARLLVEALQRRGVNIWWDQMIEAGVDWRDAIVDNLVESQVLLILFSDECNDSKQLKKELALADDMDKNVVPILIEDTKPKGHFLYELASRNWIQIHPHPERKIEELADKLMAMTGAGVAASSPAATSAPAATEKSVEKSVSKRVSKSKKQKLKQSQSQSQKRTKNYRNFLPFKWIDLPVILGAPLAIFFTFAKGDLDNDGIIGSLFYGVCIIAVYGALVFPIRYFMRNLRLGRAAVNYLGSAVFLYLAAFAMILVYSLLEGRWHHDNFGILLAAGIGWAVLGVIAFIIYGVMHFIRSMRAFRSHVEEI